MGSKNEEMNLEQLEVPVSLKNFSKSLPQRFRDGEYDASRMEQVDRDFEMFNKSIKKQWTVGKKAIATTFAVAASFLLFVGSGFVSPAMAKMISKIPPLSSIYERFEGENLSVSIEKALKKEGYPVKQVAEHVGGKKEGVYVFLEASDQNIKKMKPDVEKVSLKIIHGEKFKGTRTEDYYVKVRKYMPPSKDWEQKQAKEEKESQEILDIVEPVLKEKGYDFSWGWGNDKVELEFPSNDSKEKMTDIKKAVENALEAAGKENVEVTHKTFNLEKRQQYGRWGDAIGGIGAELMTYKKYQVSMVSHVSKGGVFQIDIRIKLSSTDPKAGEHAEELTGMIEDFIHTDEVWQKVKDDPYEITITSKDKKTLLTKTKD
jgi:Protein of unknown function (DUF4030)